jgi:hypothetical protein
MVFKRDAEGTVKEVSDGKVVVYAQGVDTTGTETKGTVLIKSAEELENYSKWVAAAACVRVCEGGWQERLASPLDGASPPMQATFWHLIASVISLHRHRHHHHPVPPQDRGVQAGGVHQGHRRLGGQGACVCLGGGMITSPSGGWWLRPLRRNSKQSINPPPLHPTQPPLLIRLPPNSTLTQNKQVVASGGAIGEMAMHFIEKYGMMALRIPSKFDMRRFCRATGATAMTKLQAPGAADLGYVKHVVVREIGNVNCVVLQQVWAEAGLAGGVSRGCVGLA